MYIIHDTLHTTMPRIIMPREVRSRYINPLAVAGSFFSFDPRVTLSS